MHGNGKILVIRGGAIGDFVLTLPVLRALRTHFPEATLEVLAYPKMASLAGLGGLAQATHSIEGRSLATFFAEGTELPEALSDYFSEFDVIISYLYDPDEVFQDNVRRCSLAQFLAGPHRPDESLDLHATAVLLKPLERLAVFDADPVPRLELPSAKAPHLARVALHPGSGSRSKNWPETKWRELLERLAAETDWEMLLVGGEAEEDRLARLASDLPESRVALLRNQSLPEVAVEVARCRLFVGHDSGISHLAAAAGTPSLVLWGETNENIWRPLGEHVTILRHRNGLDSLSVEEVLQACRRQWIG